MKCIKNGSTIKRVDDKTATKKVAEGWNYTSKEEWKKATRKETPKVEVAVEEAKTEKEHGLKAKDRKKSNKKSK